MTCGTDKIMEKIQKSGIVLPICIPSFNSKVRDPTRREILPWSNGSHPEEKHELEEGETMGKVDLGKLVPQQQLQQLSQL